MGNKSSNFCPRVCSLRMSGSATEPFHHDEIKIQLLYFHIITCRFLLSPHDCCQTAITSIKRHAVKAFFSEFSDVAPVFLFQHTLAAAFRFPYHIYFPDFLWFYCCFLVCETIFLFSPDHIILFHRSYRLSPFPFTCGKMRRSFFNCPTSIITALIIFSCGLLVFSLAVGFGELYKYVLWQ